MIWISKEPGALFARGLLFQRRCVKTIHVGLQIDGNEYKTRICGTNMGNELRTLQLASAEILFPEVGDSLDRASHNSAPSRRAVICQRGRREDVGEEFGDALIIVGFEIIGDLEDLQA